MWGHRALEVSQSASKQMEADLPLTSPKTNTIDPATDEAETWVMAVTGLKKPDEMELQAWLKSGVVLCNLANCLKPGLVAKVSEVQKPFKQMENISAYLEACGEYGVPAQDNFLTVDLFEGKNMGAVVRNLHSLGRVAQAHGFQGPTLGTRLSTPNRRSFTEQQAIAGRDAAGPRDVRPVSAQSSSTLLSQSGRTRSGPG